MIFVIKKKKHPENPDPENVIRCRLLHCKRTTNSKTRWKLKLFNNLHEFAQKKLRIY